MHPTTIGRRCHNGFVPLPRLPLAPPPPPGELLAPFVEVDPVLWIEGAASRPEAITEALRASLGSRCLRIPVRAVPVVGPRPGRSPWATRQDLQQPLRWGPSAGLEGAPSLAEALDAHRLPSVGGVVLFGICASLPDQALRALLRQLAPRLLPEAPWLASEPNGRQLARIARGLRRSEGARGEGRGVVRSVEELRRLFETGGRGGGAPPRRGPGGGGWPADCSAKTRHRTGCWSQDVRSAGEKP